MSGKAAVVCPGPSVHSTWSSTIATQYDHVIAVNNAAPLVTDGWWFFIDPDAFTLTAPNPRLRLITQMGVINLLAAVGDNAQRLMAFPGVYAREVYLTWQPQHAFGLDFAVMLATALGADRVDLYGVDWRGSASFDGIEQDGRSDRRWTEEIFKSACMFDWLRRRFGVRVRRVLPPGHPPLPSWEWGLALPDEALDEMGLKVLAPGELEREGRVRFVERGGRISVNQARCITTRRVPEWWLTPMKRAAPAQP